LTAARALTNGTLFVVCGCGGDRDRAKRSIMGAAAARLADVVIITDDNPRTEEPSLIRRQMLGGVSEAKMSIYSPDWLTTRAEGETGCVEIAGRAAAIAVAVTSGKVGDIVLIAGKGHERYQQLGDETIFFDDALWARQSVLSWNQTTVAEAAAAGESLTRCDRFSSRLSVPIPAGSVRVISSLPCAVNLLTGMIFSTRRF
jgi:UDP-N-acetylmuramyl tripeptide synthase